MNKLTRITRSTCLGAALALVVFGALACEEERTTVNLQVQARTNQGDPVDAAVVVVGGDEVGETDGRGRFKTQIDLPAGKPAELRVKKESETYYFAPYFRAFDVADDGPQEMDVNATLYFVPKPSPGSEKGQNSVASVEPRKPGAAQQEKAKAGSSDGDAADLQAQAGADNASAEASADDSSGVKVKEGAKSTATQKSKADEKSASAATTEPGDSKAEVFSSVDKKNGPLRPAGGSPDDEVEFSEHPVLLTDVGEAEQKPIPMRQAYPKPSRSNDGPTIYTVLTYANDDPLPGVAVYLGRDDDKDLKKACATNKRGRCAIRFDKAPNHTVSIVAKKKGFKTKSRAVRIKDKGRVSLELQAGKTIDVFAITKSFNYTKGLDQVAVFVNGGRVGSTDDYGHFSYVYTGKKEDLVSVALKPEGYLPETFETDFVASQTMTLRRYFAPQEPPAVRMTLLPVQPAGKVSETDLEAFDGDLDRKIRDAAIKYLYASAAFKDYSGALFQRAAKRTGRSLGSLMRKGWQSTPLKAQVDALVLPTLVTGAQTALELSVIDSKGRVLAAAKKKLEDRSDKASLKRAVEVLAAKITRAFPFEGAVLGKEDGKVRINLGRGSGRALKAGDVAEVYGVQSDKLGRKQVHGRIANLTVTEVDDQTSLAKISDLAPRATISRGDLVVLRPRNAPSRESATVLVTGNPEGIGDDPIPQANVYLNGEWIGATNKAGRLYADVTGRGRMKVVKHGFRSREENVHLNEGSEVKVQLRRETAFIRVESQPAGAAVFVEDRRVGKTPFQSPIPVPAGFVKLRVKGPAGYKDYESVLELDEGTLDLTGPNAVTLERAFLRKARALRDDGRVQEAVERYEKIPKDHSDYLRAQHELGELYLSVLDEPAKAAEAFGNVTSAPAVKQFSDKRFIGSHINEGIALFMTAETLEKTNERAAVAHYQKAHEVLENVTPHLRFVPDRQYEQAVHNVDFHKALSMHRVWLNTKNKAHLQQAMGAWRSYIKGSAASVPVQGQTRRYVKNAQVYFKQAKEAL